MLIDKTEIEKHREISRSVKDKKINPFIEDAEFLDLRPLLGDALYYDLIKSVNEPKYQELLTGSEYTNGERNYKQPGLNKILSIFSYARYVLFGSYSDTAFGFVQKSSPDSQPVPESQKRNIYTKDRQTATQYFNEIILFLNRNQDIYPEWKSSCSKPIKGGFRISKIST